MSTLKTGFILLFSLLVACSSANEGDPTSTDGLTLMPPGDDDCDRGDCDDGYDEQCDDWQDNSEGDQHDCELDCPRSGPTGPIAVHFECSEVHIVSCKELSNVVLAYTDGEHSKFDGLKGNYGTFGGGEREIAAVWVKAGSNGSGDGPGYGERFDSEAECDDGGTGGTGGHGGDMAGAGGMGGSDCDDGYCEDDCDDHDQTCEEDCDGHYDSCKDDCDGRYDGCKDEGDHHYEGCKHECDEHYDGCKYGCDEHYDGCKYDCDHGHEACKAECDPGDDDCEAECDHYYDTCKYDCDETYDDCKYECDHGYEGCKHGCDEHYEGGKYDCDEQYEGCKYECDEHYEGCDDQCDDGHHDGGHHCSCDPWFDCLHDGSLGYIEVDFECSAIHVSSCKDISNVVLEFATGEHRKFDDLEDQCVTIGAGDEVIAGAWVKAGSNKSGDGPGYGERFDSDANCDGAGGNGGAGGDGRGGEES